MRKMQNEDSTLIWVLSHERLSSGTEGGLDCSRRCEFRLGAVFRWALLVVLSATLTRSASGREFTGGQVVHVDEATDTILLSAWDGDRGYEPNPAHLYRATMRLWRGRVPPVLRDGITFSEGIDVECLRCIPGAVPEEGSWVSIRFSYQAAHVFGKEDGQLELQPLKDVVQISDSCRGKWVWTGVQPECVRGPPQESPLSIAWQHWNDRDKLTLLLYLYDYHALGIPIPGGILCNKAIRAKDLNSMHRCQPSVEAEYLDPIVAVAHNIAPLPAIPATAIGSAMRANDDMKAVKSAEDLWKVITDYDTVVSEAPWWADAYYNRARVEALYGLYLWAVADYERVLKLNPSPEVAADVRQKIGELQY